MNNNVNRLGLIILLLVLFRVITSYPETMLEKIVLLSVGLLSLSFLLYQRQEPTRHNCIICGTRLERWQKICSYCGRDNSSNMCPKCGRSIWDHGIGASVPNSCKYLER